MRPSETCKQAGLDSLAELVRLSQVPKQTLLDWHKTKQKLFALVLLGVVTQKQSGEV